jgi:hypothetical protein
MSRVPIWLSTKHIEDDKHPRGRRLCTAYLGTSLLMKLPLRRPRRRARVASRGSKAWPYSFPGCSGESGLLLLIPSDDSTLSSSFDEERNESNPGSSAVRSELIANRPRAAKVPSSDESLCLRSPLFGERSRDPCLALKVIRYLMSARAGLTSSSVMQASGLRFASGCGSDVFRPER